MRIAIGSDESGFHLKEAVRAYLAEQTAVEIVEVKDFGVYDITPMDYPDVALQVAEAVAAGEFDRGILVCGTGIGMAIVANKVPKVRAAQVYDPYSADRARKSNDAQIITLGGLVTGVEVAKSLIKIWLVSEYRGGRSARKVAKICEIDEKYHPTKTGL